MAAGDLPALRVVARPVAWLRRVRRKGVDISLLLYVLAPLARRA
ncbi:MAG TPA: hypothetical protein VF188_04395 [Longimicrobiales bacterium]